MNNYAEMMSDEVLKHFEELKAQFTYTLYELVPHHDSDGDWHLTVKKDGKELVHNLLLMKIDWYNLYIMLKAMERQGQYQFRLGQEDAVNRLSKHMLHVIDNASKDE